LIDPGDGSGTFQPVTNDKRLEFLSNGNVVSNYELCSFSSSEGNTYFTLPYDADENYILTNECGFPLNNNINYSLDGENLILSFNCIEGCAQKFEKVVESN
jgi:hypothetical protein